MPVTDVSHDLEARTLTIVADTFVSTYASAEALQKVLDMGVIEGARSAINQIDDLLVA